MLTLADLLRVVLAPVIVAAVIAGVGLWRRWAWAMPLAAGAGFLTGYALAFSAASDYARFVPRLPPRDGTDWLFWLAIPLTVLGVIDALVGKRWGWALATASGAVAWVIVAPLLPETVKTSELAMLATALALGAVAVALCIHFAEPRVTATAVVAALCITLGAAAVVVLSSNLRIAGVYGIAASAALGPVAVFAWRTPRAGRAVAITALPFLAGLLVGGHYYPDPGVTWVNLSTLLAAPALLLIGLAIPGKRDWVRGICAVLAVTIVVAVVTVPTALAAKQAAEAVEDDPAAAYYQY